MNATARLWSGGALAAVGVLCWALTLAIFEPALRAGGDTVVDGPAADALGQLLLWPIDLRWGAMVLSVGGLLIAVRARVAIVLTLPVWLALDLTLYQVEVSGWPAFAALVAGAGIILAAGVAMAAGVGLGTQAEPVQAGTGPAAEVVAAPHFTRATEAGAGPGILVYCGVAAALAPLMFNVVPDTRLLRPQAMMAVAILLSLGLAVSAVLAALTAARPSGERGIVVALGLALSVAAPTIAVQWWFADVHNPGNLLMAVPWAAAPVLLLGCVLLAKGRPVTRMGWIGTGLQAAVVSGLSFVLILFGLVLSLLIRSEYLDRPDDTYQIILGGLVAGPFIGVVAMLGGRSPKAAWHGVPSKNGRDAVFHGRES